jgi:hypothetical protein
MPDYRHRESFVIVDPIKVFSVIGSSIGALLLFIFIYVLVPTNSEEPWPAQWAGGWALMFFAPLAT